MTGRIHSLQSLGTVDGPGIRFVVFMQGCPLHCSCCHNPDTRDMLSGTLYTPDEILQKALRCREYFGSEGGITVSGGEPLVQARFVTELFRLCHENAVNTCLDTSGCLLTEDVKELLSHTDRALLDIKYTESESYEKEVGCEYERVLLFLSYLDKNSIPTTLRQVIIPTLNDSEENAKRLKKLADAHACVDKVELLPFRKLCQVKYDKMGIKFPLENTPEPTSDTIKQLYEIING